MLKATLELIYINKMEKDLFFNVADIVKRAKRVLNFKIDADLAAYLGVSRSTLSNWIARNSIDFPLLLSKMKDVDYNWLLVGKGTPMSHLQSYHSELATGNVEIIHNSKTPDAMKDRSVVLYDITAAANLRTLLANKHQFVMGRIQIPSIPVCDGALYIRGTVLAVSEMGGIGGLHGHVQLQQCNLGEIYLFFFGYGRRLCTGQ